MSCTCSTGERMVLHGAALGMRPHAECLRPAGAPAHPPAPPAPATREAEYSLSSNEYVFLSFGRPGPYEGVATMVNSADFTTRVGNVTYVQVCW